MEIGDDVLGKFLAAASKLGVNVLVGLQLIPMPDSAIAATGKLYIDLATDLYSHYGRLITNYKSKWRNIWIRDVFCSQHLRCWALNQHTSRIQHKEV